MADHVEEWISSYIDHELDEADRVRLAAHLELCSQCRAMYEDLLDIQNQVLEAYRSVEIPDDLEQRVISAVNVEHEIEAGESKSSLIWSLFTVTGISCLFVLWFVLLSSSIGLRLASVFFKVLFNLVYAFGGVIASDPYLTAGVVLLSSFLMVASGLSLHRLLKAKMI